jgi:uncharacterized protein
MKISKLCNLRCSYCYEYGDLANKRRMSLATIGRIFDNMARYVAAHPHEFMSFVWHGGEPFLIPLEFYDSIRVLQEKTFSARVTLHNSVQTNLTILAVRHLEFLKSRKFFTAVGVSFDVHGDQRVDNLGRQKIELVLGNLQKLLDSGIRFGAIVVLARNTLPHVTRIYEFYDRLGVECRFIPFYKHSFIEQISDHALTFDELIGALKSVFDAWIVSERATAVDPIDEYTDYAVAHLSGQPKRYYNKGTDEYAFVVDVDGGVWGHGEAYDGEFKYGNLGHESFDAILASRGRRQALASSKRRVAMHCEKCRYYGACPGSFVADASTQQQWMLAEAGCPVKEVLHHIIATLERTKLSNAISAGAAKVRRGNPALSIGM